MKRIKSLLLVCSLLLTSLAHAEKITVAAAADLKFAMDEFNPFLCIYQKKLSNSYLRKISCNSDCGRVFRNSIQLFQIKAKTYGASGIAHNSMFFRMGGMAFY